MKVKRKREKYQAGRDYARQKVRIRDNFTCRKCGTIKREGRALDIHHLNGLCGRKSRSCDKVKNIDELITLCHKCHLNLPEVREKMEMGHSKVAEPSGTRK